MLRFDHCRRKKIFTAAINASTISFDRSGEKRQSLVNDMTRKRAWVCSSAVTNSPPAPRWIKVVQRSGHQQIGVGVESLGKKSDLGGAGSFRLETPHRGLCRCRQI